MFIHTNIYQFSTTLKLNNEILETVDNTKLLGTIITNDLTWDLYTNNIVMKAFARMELLKKKLHAIIYAAGICCMVKVENPS